MAHNLRLTYLPQLDGLRAVAVILVLMAHFPAIERSAISMQLWHLIQAVRPGYIGVDLFFMLSGFLITRILATDRVQYGRASYRVFYIKRSLRIFPIYYIAIVACWVVFQMPIRDVLTFGLYGGNLGLLPTGSRPLDHTWSLAVEEQFYLVWPLLMNTIALRHGRLVTGFLIPGVGFVASLMIAATIGGTLGASLIYQLPITRMMSLSLGAYLAFREIEQRPVGGAIAAPSIIIGICLAVTAVIGRAVGVIPPGAFYWVVANVANACVSFGVISTLIFGRSTIAIAAAGLLRFSSLRYLGWISYGVYLYHYPVLYAFHIEEARTAATGAPLLRVIAALLTTMGIAVISYHFVELPLLRFKAQVSQRKEVPSAVGVIRPAESADSLGIELTR